MREIPLSLPEKTFIIKAAAESKRLDGRKLEEFRPTEVHFGNDWGSCFVTLGQTKVLACASCEVQEPQATRPNDGLLFLNVEVTAMAAPHLDGGTRSELGVHLNRMLEKCLKESKAVDLEALCIVAEEKVWALRVDLNVINHEGNLLDCASLAALAALAHFKRPDVTTDGQDVTIHDPSERDPIPITLHHYPVCVSFAYMSEGDKILSDPTALEERVADASLVFGVNGYRELCGLHMGGSAVLPPKQIMRCATRAALQAKKAVDALKESIAQDLKDREAGRPVGFASCCELNKITSLSQDTVKIQLAKFRLSQPFQSTLEERNMVVDQDESSKEMEGMEVIENEKDACQVVDLGDNTAELVAPTSFKKKRHSGGPVVSEIKYGEGGPSLWGVVEVDSMPVSTSNVAEAGEIEVMPIPARIIQSVELSGDSDEDEVYILDSMDVQSAERVGSKLAKKATPQNVPHQHVSKQQGKKKKGKRNRP